LLRAHLAMPAAQVATPRAGTRFGALALARFARGGDVDLDLDILAMKGIVEADFEIITQVGAALRLLAARATTAAKPATAPTAAEVYVAICELRRGHRGQLRVLIGATPTAFILRQWLRRRGPDDGRERRGTKTESTKLSSHRGSPLKRSIPFVPFVVDRSREAEPR